MNKNNQSSVYDVDREIFVSGIIRSPLGRVSLSASETDDSYLPIVVFTTDLKARSVAIVIDFCRANLMRSSNKLIEIDINVIFERLYSKDRVKHDSFRVFNAFVTRFSCACMKRVLKRVDSRFSRYKRVSQQPIKSALQ